LDDARRSTPRTTIKGPETRLAASFRDPSGFVFRQDGNLLRQVNAVYLPVYRQFMASGLYQDLVTARLIVEHEEVDPAPWADGGAAAILKPKPLSMIAYPYEWCFGQLKDAALATLDIQRRALDKGMWLKDASAYNIQFVGDRPVLIDTLSFDPYVEGEPWPAYRQFCEHFLSPLALMSWVDIRLGRLQREYIDGVPLDLCSNLLPGRSKLNPGLAIHVHAHAKAQSSQGERKATGKVAKNGLLGMLDSLRSTIQHLEWKPEGTVWANYYNETNYTDSAFAEKKRLVGSMLDAVSPVDGAIWDLGANTGEFSVLVAERGIDCVSWDIDPAAVERNYRTHRLGSKLLPLLQDLTNPSSGTGWANRERDSLAARGPAAGLLALALVHHLAIGNNVPLKDVADYFASLAEWAIVEFVPKSDSQTQRLLASRKDIYANYTPEGFEAAFAGRFEMHRKEAIVGTERTLYLLKRRPSATIFLAA